MRLITFNIAHGRGLSLYQGFHSAGNIESKLKKITKILTDAGADIVAMQEVDEGSFWNKNINLLDVIRNETPYRYSYFGINNVREGALNLSYGNALLSRHPIGVSHNQPFKHSQIGGKGFMYTEIDIGTVRLPIINIHLDFRSRSRRVKQIDQVIEFIDERSRDNAGDLLKPVICGDFNCRADRVGDAVQRISDYLDRDREYALVPLGANTFPAHFPTRTIDLIFMPDQFKVTQAEVLPVYASDHRPVLVEFELPTAPD